MLRSVGLALHALCQEVLGFRFEYPLEIVPEAGSKGSLAYYLYSESLAWKAMRLDSQGIPQTWTRLTGARYMPGYIAWYGLVKLGHYHRHGDKESLDAFFKQTNWLEQHTVLRSDGAAVWHMGFDHWEGATLIRAPWISAHVQGLVISALVRDWRLTRRAPLLAILARSMQVFDLDCEHGGIRVVCGGHVTYNEKPGTPAPVILDGFLTSLLGLFDLSVELGDPVAERLFNEGIDGLKDMLPAWDYRGKWSWYGSRAYLCPPQYHCLNRVLLMIIARVANEPRLAECAESWNHDRLSALERAEIYFAFLFTKNACRFKHRTWRQRTETHWGASPRERDPGGAPRPSSLIAVGSDCVDESTPTSGGENDIVAG